MYKGWNGLKAPADTGYAQRHNLQLLMIFFLKGFFDLYMDQIWHLHGVWSRFTVNSEWVKSDIYMGWFDIN